MDKLSINSCDLDKSFKKHNNISSLELFTCPYSLIIRRCHSFSKKITSDLSSQNSTAQSIKKFNSPKNIRKRKDIFGNVIEKGGKQKISFRDNFKGKYLVEMTLIDPKQNSLRGKNYKNYTIFREARDKEEVLCSGACNIF
jgi:hypothetical protein